MYSRMSSLLRLRRRGRTVEILVADIEFLQKRVRALRWQLSARPIPSSLWLHVLGLINQLADRRCRLGDRILRGLFAEPDLVQCRLEGLRIDRTEVDRPVLRIDLLVLRTLSHHGQLCTRDLQPGLLYIQPVFSQRQASALRTVLDWVNTLSVRAHHKLHEFPGTWQIFNTL